MGRQVTQRLKGLERKAAAILANNEPLPERPQFHRIITLLCEGQGFTPEEAQRIVRQGDMVHLPDEILAKVIVNLEIANTTRDEGPNAAAIEVI